MNQTKEFFNSLSRNDAFLARLFVIKWYSVGKSRYGRDEKRSASVIIQRNNGATLQEIGIVLKITPERVRCVETIAIRRLKALILWHKKREQLRQFYQ